MAFTPEALRVHRGYKYAFLDLQGIILRKRTFHLKKNNNNFQILPTTGSSST